MTDHPKKLENGGLWMWAAHGVRLVLTASSRGTQGTAEHLVGKEHYARFDAQVPAGLYTLDNADAEDLAGLAAGVSRHLAPTFTDKFADHTAAPYQLFHPTKNVPELTS